MDDHPNLNDLRVPKRPNIERASRFVAIAIQHLIFEKWLDFILDKQMHFVIHLLLDYDENFQLYIFYYIHM